MNALAIKVVIVIILLIGGWYVKHLIEQNVLLKAEREGYIEEVKGYKTALGAVMDGYQEADDEKARLEKKLAKHDLAALARSKPKMVSDRINRGTASMFAAIEAASRASPSPKASTDTH